VPDEVLADRGSILRPKPLHPWTSDAGGLTVAESTRRRAATWISGAGVRIGFNAEQRWTGRCYTAKIITGGAGHRIERDQVTCPLGIEPRTHSRLVESEDDARVDQLAARLGIASDRSWVVVQGAILVQGLAAGRCRDSRTLERSFPATPGVLVAGSPQEAALTQAIIDHAKSRLLNIARP
jgi:hypothetical protein